MTKPLTTLLALTAISFSTAGCELVDLVEDVIDSQDEVSGGRAEEVEAPAGESGEEIDETPGSAEVRYVFVERPGEESIHLEFQSSSPSEGFATAQRMRTLSAGAYEVFPAGEHTFSVVTEDGATVLDAADVVLEADKAYTVAHLPSGEMLIKEDAVADGLVTIDVVNADAAGSAADGFVAPWDGTGYAVEHDLSIDNGGFQGVQLAEQGGAVLLELMWDLSGSYNTLLVDWDIQAVVNDNIGASVDVYAYSLGACDYESYVADAAGFGCDVVAVVVEEDGSLYQLEGDWGWASR